MEILSAELFTNQTLTFSFHSKVEYFLVGFSKFVIEYSESDHHVKEISIDLTNCQVDNNKVTVTPRLQMYDSSGNSESIDSAITIVVFASTGYKNTSIFMTYNTKTNVDHILPLCNPIFYKSCLQSMMVQFPEEDHHLNKFASNIDIDIDLNDGFNEVIK